MSSKITIDLGRTGFTLTNEYVDDTMSVSREGHCPFPFFVGRDCKYRSEVVRDMVKFVGMDKDAEISISESAIEKIDSICSAARLLF